MTDVSSPPDTFESLGLPSALLATLRELGYEAPSPIQAATIPALLDGRNVLGQAQTGTGKTAAFALPMLARIAGSKRGASRPSGLVLAPTRELALQVAEAIHRYAQDLPGFHVLPIYGGQAYGPQLNGLRRGPDVVVGTPGRIIDHLGKGTLNIEALQTLVLDEADEMLRMGFIDDVREVMDRIPDHCQKALFSATMPDPIRRIAERHMADAEHITVRSTTTTAANIRQRYWVVGGVHKLDALTRILEVEDFDAMICFARTRIATEQLAQRLEARGFSAAALNGDVPQKQREQIVERLKRGEIDILAATDVAARGLDVDRISHVVNYDIPYDTEAYVHRIGRTGRAGRSGEAILFVAPRERGMLRAIERATRQPIEPMTLPTVGDVHAQRQVRFQARIQAALEGEELDEGRSIVQQSLEALDAEIHDLAAALAVLARGETPRLGTDRPPASFDDGPSGARHGDRHGNRHGNRRSGQSFPDRSGSDKGRRPPRPKSDQDAGLTGYRIEVGARHGVKPGNIVGAIANEAKLDASQIGRINIQQDFSIVDLPGDLSGDVLNHLGEVRVAGQALRIQPDPGAPHRSAPSSDRPGDRSNDRYSKGPGKDPGKRPSFKKSAAPVGDRPPMRRPSSDRTSGDERGSSRPLHKRPKPGTSAGSPSAGARTGGGPDRRSDERSAVSDPERKRRPSLKRPPRTRAERKASFSGRPKKK